MIVLQMIAAWSLCGAPNPEAQVRAAVVHDFERRGRTAPQEDAALDRAAQATAQKAISGSAQAAANPQSLATRLSKSGGWDPLPRTVVVKSDSVGSALRAFASRSDYGDEPASHLGIGFSESAGKAAIVALLVQRKLWLRDFPRRFTKPPARGLLCGHLVAPLSSPEVEVTQPSGKVLRIPSSSRGDEFCATLPFAAAGQYTVEVLGRSAHGPEVAGLFHVDVGRVSIPEAMPAEETRDLSAARAAVLSRINALRKSQRVSPLRPDFRLQEIAQAYSERMTRENFFAHVAPNGETLRDRLAKAGYMYDRASENLGMASGPLAAQMGIEQSPGHRKNLIDPESNVVGLGLSFEETSNGPQVRLVELFASAYHESGDPMAEAYGAVNARRAAHGLPLLRRNPALERLAQIHAADVARSPEAPGRNWEGDLHAKIFRTVPGLRLATANLVVTSQPEKIGDSNALLDRATREVGIGIARAEGPSGQKGRFWLVIIYAQPNRRD